jgi:hypothetical protein
VDAHARLTGRLTAGADVPRRRPETHGGEAMATRRGRLLPALLLLTVACTFGCNPLTSFFFLAPDSKIPAQLRKVAADDRTQEVTVAVLTYTGLETRPEFLRVDRDLSNLVVKQLREGFKANGESVKVVPPAKVEEFKNNHPNWHTMELTEIGSRLNADYVIYLEVSHLSLYEPGSANSLYRGRADITVNLVDAINPDETPETKELNITFPTESGGVAIPAEDKSPQLFKEQFYKRIATQVAWQFTAHLTREDYHQD